MYSTLTLLIDCRDKHRILRLAINVKSLLNMHLRAQYYRAVPYNKESISRGIKETKENRSELRTCPCMRTDGIIAS